MNINIGAFKNINLRLIVDTVIELTAKGLKCNCKLYSFMRVDCRLKQESVDRVTAVAMSIVYDIRIDMTPQIYFYLRKLILLLL